jgi:hypothetical protein
MSDDDYPDDFHATNQKMQINVYSDKIAEPNMPKSCANSLPKKEDDNGTATDHHKALKQMTFNQAMMSENQQSDKFDSVAHTINDQEGSKERESKAELSAAVFS